MVRPLAAFLAILGTGCASLPKNDAIIIAAKGPPPATIEEKCGVGLATAKRCALFVSDRLGDYADTLANWESGFSVTMLAAGLVGVAYSKSSTDRSQALEDLAIGVAAVTGIRSILSPREKRLKAIQAQGALACMIRAADVATRAVALPEISPPSSTKSAMEFLAPSDMSELQQEAWRASTSSLLRVETHWYNLARRRNDTTQILKSLDLTAGRQLADGIAQVLRVLRGEIGDLRAAAAGSDLLGTQQQVVDKMIGRLGRAATAEMKAKTEAKVAMDVASPILQWREGRAHGTGSDASVSAWRNWGNDLLADEPAREAEMRATLEVLQECGSTAVLD